MLELKIPPPLQLLAFGLLMWGIAKFVPDPGFRPPGLPWSALACVVAGIAMGAAGLVEFRRAQTTVDPLEPSKATALVVRGIFRVTRNPMYVGLLMILVGWSLYLGSWLALLVLPLFVVFITRFQIRPEERVMAEKFGEAYADYCAQVRRWL